MCDKQPEQMAARPERNGSVYSGFPLILDAIKGRSDTLSRYVHKYFVDMYGHCRALINVVKPGGSVHYIVGNSKFYDVLLPVEEIYAAMFESVGFESISVQATRKRTSKKELFEFVVAARRPPAVPALG